MKNTTLCYIRPVQLVVAHQRFYHFPHNLLLCRKPVAPESIEFSFIDGADILLNVTPVLRIDIVQLADARYTEGIDLCRGPAGTVPLEVPVQTALSQSLSQLVIGQYKMVQTHWYVALLLQDTGSLFKHPVLLLVGWQPCTVQHLLPRENHRKVCIGESYQPVRT